MIPRATASPAAARGEHDRRQLAQARSGDPAVFDGSVTSMGRAQAEVRRHGRSSAVRGPRPSRARTAAPSAAMPRSPPPPQSPEWAPSAASRAVPAVRVRSRPR